MSPIPLPCVRNESEREVSAVKSWGGGLNRNPGEVPATSWILRVHVRVLDRIRHLYHFILRKE